MHKKTIAIVLVATALFIMMPFHLATDKLSVWKASLCGLVRMVVVRNFSSRRDCCLLDMARVSCG